MFGNKVGNNESKKSVSGKDLDLNDERDVLYIRDLDENETYTGRPIVSIFKLEGKTYNGAIIRLVNEDEELRLNVNYPKKDCPLVKNLNNNIFWFLNAFNLVKDISILTGAEGVDDRTGAFKEVNFKEILEFVDGLDEIEIMAYYPEDSGYMSFRVVKTL